MLEFLAEWSPLEQRLLDTDRNPWLNAFFVFLPVPLSRTSTLYWIRASVPF